MITESGEVFNRYVRLINLSEGGLKMSGDLPHPEGAFYLEFQSKAVCREKLDQMPEIRLKIDNRWKTELYGDMWVGGFAFLELTDQQKQVINELICQHKKEESRPEPEAEKALSLGVVTGRGTGWYYPLITRLDLECIEFQSTEKIDLDGPCQLSLRFRETDTAVLVNARLVWRRELNSTYRYCLSFHGLSPDAMLAIQSCRRYAKGSQPAA